MALTMGKTLGGFLSGENAQCISKTFRNDEALLIIYILISTSDRLVPDLHS